jgi:hypothetical protein
MTSCCARTGHSCERVWDPAYSTANMPTRTRQAQDDSQRGSTSAGSSTTTTAIGQEHTSTTKGYTAFLITERDGQCTYVLQPIRRPFGPNQPPPGSTMGDAVESVMRRLEWSFENEPNGTIPWYRI